MNIFSYGSLMFPEVMYALTKKSFLFEDVVLHNFERMALIGKQYLGLCEKAGAFVNGRVWFDLNSESRKLLAGYKY